MKLIDFLVHGQLNSLRHNMGATLASNFTSGNRYVAIDLPLVARLREDGIDVNFDEIEVLRDGTLSYKGFRVLIYIRDVANYGERQSLPKYHLAYCRTLETMRQNNRWGRYVVANREDGMFSINIVAVNSSPRVDKLDVCQNCLTKIKWRGFDFSLTQARRGSLVKSFDLKEFFVKFPRDLVSVTPEHSSDSAPLNDYPANWSSISDQFKVRAQFTCAKCRQRLGRSDSRFLHVHHKNGLKNDCSDRNLEVVCIRCHASEPMHSHIRSTPDYRTFISRFGSAVR